MTLGPVVRETGELFGRPDVRFVCGCGWRTDAYPPDVELLAATDMTEHLADEHGDELGVGRCANCAEPTDHLQIRGAPGGTAWLCEDCAPAPEGLATMGA